MTSNPSIFEKAMGGGTNYDPGFKTLAGKGDHDAQDIYEALAIEDIQDAADLLRPVYDATNKVDGYVSFEVSPYLALRTEETIAEARRLWKAVGRDNLMVKVPGTAKWRARHPDADLRRHQHQRHAAVRAKRLRGGGRRVHRGIDRVPRQGRRCQPRRQRRQLLRQPHRQRRSTRRSTNAWPPTIPPPPTSGAIRGKVAIANAQDGLSVLPRPAADRPSGRRLPMRGQCRNACFGPAPAPRTRHTATCCTSRNSSAPTRWTPSRPPPWTPSATTGMRGRR